MPTYEYECRDCKHRFEKFQSMSEPPLEDCPECATGKVKRLISGGAGILFKGSGFYSTDYRSDSYRKSEKSESGGGAEASSDKGDGGTKKKPKKTAEKKPPGGSSPGKPASGD